MPSPPMIRFAWVSRGTDKLIKVGSVQICLEVVFSTTGEAFSVFIGFAFLNPGEFVPDHAARAQDFLLFFFGIRRTVHFTASASSGRSKSRGQFFGRLNSRRPAGT